MGWFIRTIGAKGEIDTVESLLRPQSHPSFMVNGHGSTPVHSSACCANGSPTAPEEPLVAESPLWALDNVLLSSHNADLTPTCLGRGWASQMEAKDRDNSMGVAKRIFSLQVTTNL